MVASSLPRDDWFVRSAPRRGEYGADGGARSGRAFGAARALQDAQRGSAHISV
jgi:hypothetical protein